MATKPNKVKFNLKNVHVAKMTKTDEGAYTYGTPRAIPGAVNLNLDSEGDNSPFYADGIVYFRATSNNGYSGDLEMAMIPDWFREEFLQEIKDDNGVLIESANVTDQVYFALMFEFDGDQRKIRHVMYQCSVSRPTIASQTKESSITPVTESLSLTADPRDDGLVKGKTSDDTESTIYQNWFTTVYQPELTEGEEQEEAPQYALLSALTIGSLELSPAFSAGTTSYTATTSNATNAVSATGEDGTSVAITVNNAAHTNGQSATWNTGTNTVSITVTRSGYTSTVYTVIVTKE